jgi:putative heme-binding domain-containing protein
MISWGLLRRASLACLAVLLLGPVALEAQEVPATNAFSVDREALRIGMGVFRQRCAECHGVDARGVRGPDLTQLWAAGRTDDGIFRTITEGVPGTNMRPVDRVRTRDSEVWQVIAYLHSIASPGVTKPAGDPARGQQLFAATCSVCHQVDAHGGRVGPDLSRIGIARSVESLKRRVRGDYGRTVDPSFAPTTLTAADGERIQGVKRNEDLLSIQVIDIGGRIQGFKKDTLRELDVSTTSIMPAFSEEMLGDAALEDLVSYLVTLRGYDAAVK